MRESRLSRRPRLFAVAAAAALALGVAGCGGGDDSSTGAEPGSVATYVPATAPVYVELSTDLDGPQWTQIDALGQKFPAFPDLKKKLVEQVNSGDVQFDRDIKPILGDRAAIALLEVPETEIPDLPSITEPSTGGTTPPRLPDADDQSVIAVLDLVDGKEADAAALLKKDGTAVGTHQGAEILKSSDGDSYAAVADGALVFSPKQADLQAALDAHAAGGDRTLGGNDRATDTLAKLPPEVVLQGYVDIGAAIKQAGQSSEQLKQLESFGLSPDAALGISVAAEEAGLRMKGVVTGATAEQVSATEFTPGLTKNAPGDALAYVGFSNLAGIVEQGITQFGAAQPDLAKQLDAVRTQLPLLLKGTTVDDLAALASKEHAIVVTKGGSYPAGGLLLEVDDSARAQRTLDSLRGALPLLAGQVGGGAQVPDFKKVTEAGVTGWQLPLSPQASVVYGTKDKLAVIGTQPSVLGLLSAPVNTLAQDADFQAATAGMPEKVGSIIWLDVEGIVEQAEALGAFKDQDPAQAKQVRDNLRPLKNVAMWSSVSDGTPTVEALLTVK